MRLKRLRAPALALAGCMSACATTYIAGTLIPVPAGLQVGDKFQLAFVTSETTQATSSDINYYNLFVNADANLSGSLVAGLGITWSALGSTGSVNVLSNIDNTPSSVPIFSLDGGLIANGTGTSGNGLYSGSLQSPIHDETGGFAQFPVSTGTNADGTTAPYPLGGARNPYGIMDVQQGDSSFSVANWTDDGEATPNVFSSSIYAISQTLVLGPGDTVEIISPEPGTIGSTLLALASCYVAMRRRKAVRPTAAASRGLNHSVSNR